MIVRRERAARKRGAGWQARASGQCPDLARVTSDRKTALPSERPPATDAELRAEQMARLREEMRRREVEG
jgi:hypothetical protein